MTMLGDKEIRALSCTSEAIRDVITKQQIKPRYWKIRLEDHLQIGELPFIPKNRRLLFWRKLYYYVTGPYMTPDRMYIRLASMRRYG